jgi:hypothetical protein
MPLATNALVRQLGGLNDDEAHLLFGLDTEPELEALITEQLAVASAWLGLTSSYYTSLDANIIAVHRQAETYITLQYLGDMLKARKVYGSHWPLDSEDSAAYSNMIDIEWEARAETLLSRFTTLDTAARPIAFPTFSVGPIVDYTNVDSAEQELVEIADQSRGWNPVSTR